ncbi:hypothetical protein ACFW91_13110 [Streptomyces asoensis]|uniref:hypothetical protein n=1 Tax=Streptomyces asoensis TaxID=249586 RepID=UPI0036AF6BE0
MSKLVMSTDYANTIAAVAPVVLLVAVVELNGHRQELRNFYESMTNRSRAAKALYAEGRSPSRQEVLDAAPELSLSSLFRGFASLLYVTSAVAVGVLLMQAELKTLSWLAGSSRGKNEFDAEFCLLAVALGFAWITFVPIVIVASSSTISTWQMVTGLRKVLRLQREQAAYRAHEDTSGAE